LLFVVRLSSDETLDPISSAAVFVASVVKCENHTQITEGGEKRLIDLIEKKKRSSSFAIGGAASANGSAELLQRNPIWLLLPSSDG